MPSLQAIASSTTSAMTKRERPHITGELPTLAQAQWSGTFAAANYKPAACQYKLYDKAMDAEEVWENWSDIESEDESESSEDDSTGSGSSSEEETESGAWKEVTGLQR